MKRVSTALVAVLVLLLPSLVLAEAPPEVQGGGSPEPAAAILLALGLAALPVAYFASRARVREPSASPRANVRRRRRCRR